MECRIRLKVIGRYGDLRIGCIRVPRPTADSAGKMWK